MASQPVYGADVDKYLIGAGTPVPCEELIPICKARCCRLRPHLSRQDVAEGVLVWDRDLPYALAQVDDGFCVHSAPDSRRCTVYEQRPAICRTYDCREDGRVWQDFEKRIPAPEDRIPNLVQIRRRLEG